MISLDAELTNAAHSVATFSELGIGVAIAVITDLPKWRARIHSADEDVVKRESARSAARDLGLSYLVAHHFVAIIRKVIWLFWFLLPVVALFLGYLALHELAKDTTTSNDHLCFKLSVWSFWIATIVASIMAGTSWLAEKGQRITEEALK